MKRLIWMAIGAVIIQQIAKYFNISSFKDLKSSITNLKDFAVSPN
ncbi:MAG: hypothetical protein ACT4ON_13700 [Bacteroidota bacterium]